MGTGELSRKPDEILRGVTIQWYGITSERRRNIIIISFVFMQLTEIIFCPLASIAKLHTIPESLSHSGVTGSKEKKKDKKIYKIIKLNS